MGKIILCTARVGLLSRVRHLRYLIPLLHRSTRGLWAFPANKPYLLPRSGWVLPLRLLVSRGHYFQRPLGRMCARPSPPETMVGDRGAGVAQSSALVWTSCPRSSGTLGAVPATCLEMLWKYFAACERRVGDFPRVSGHSGPSACAGLTTSQEFVATRV